jgi:hypothetical protein
MLTEAEKERNAFEEQERMRQYVRDFAKAKARREVIRMHKTEFLDPAAQERFERLLHGCERDADEIAREATEEAGSKASRAELTVAAYEVAYIKAYGEALPMLMATEWARRNVPDPAGAET